MAHEGHDHGDHDHDHGHGEHGPGEHGHVHREPSPAGEHKAIAPAHVAAFVITSSDTRDASTDKSGLLIRNALEQVGHTIVGAKVIRDEPDQLRAALDEAAAAGARAVIITGGTGVARRDQVIETLRPMLEKEIPGFGEIFRMLSFQEIGSPAMMSRALAGSTRGMIVFALPGSTNAVRLAMDKLILPEIGHAVRLLSL